MRPSGAPARPLPATMVSISLAVGLLGACMSDDDGSVPDPSTPVTVSEGPVAATELVTGDCLSGLAIGATERARIDSARVVACDGDHEVEVFATFTLSPADLGEPEETGDAYPGQQQIVDAADGGCDERLRDLGDEDVESVGLIAVWPTEESWSQGDRSVACAVYPTSGRFDAPGLLADP